MITVLNMKQVSSPSRPAGAIVVRKLRAKVAASRGSKGIVAAAALLIPHFRTKISKNQS